MILKLTEVIKLLKVLTISEGVELIKEMEKVFGINHSLPIGIAQDDTETKKEKDGEKLEFTLILESFPTDKKISVLKVIRTLTSLGLREVKELVESVPKIVKEKLTKEMAETAKKLIEDAGGVVSLK